MKLLSANCFKIRRPSKSLTAKKLCPLNFQCNFNTHRSPRNTSLQRTGMYLRSWDRLYLWLLILSTDKNQFIRKHECIPQSNIYMPDSGRSCRGWIAFLMDTFSWVDSNVTYNYSCIVHDVSLIYISVELYNVLLLLSFVVKAPCGLHSTLPTAASKLTVLLTT